MYFKINIATTSELLFYLISGVSFSRVLFQSLSVPSSVWGIFTPQLDRKEINFMNQTGVIFFL